MKKEAHATSATADSAKIPGASPLVPCTQGGGAPWYGSQLGANYQGDQQCSFSVWAPHAKKIEVHIVAPRERLLPLRQTANGRHEGLAEGIEPGTRYFYRLDGEVERADPASRFQPEGVHGPSEIADPAFDWTDRAWFGLPLRDYVLYELHVGTFTPEGTFDAIIETLPELNDLGVNALELMPVAQFPGDRNWGYDGVFPYAVQNTYGGPAGLKRLVDACHRAGIAVVLDVVYNHLGPEGNRLREFGPYFTDRYHTPWGPALNFDGEYSDEVRGFFSENALYWQTEFHMDALRLDAVHAIKDYSAVHFLQELAVVTGRRSEQLNRRFYLIAESDLNDARLITPPAVGGYGLNGQWSDDFHHCLHVLLTGEREGYYADYGGVQLFAKTLREGYSYTGQYSKFRKRRHGNAPLGTTARQFIVCSQNHDQIGNRLQGERLSRLTNFEGLKLAAGSVLLSPFIPLLFMGEEYGEPAPFQYITSHTDPELVEAVRQGRREEFAGFAGQGQPPDPQSETTFQQCILNRELSRVEESNRRLYRFYRELLRLRKNLPAIAEAQKGSFEVRALEPELVVQLLYRPEQAGVCVLLCFAQERISTQLDLPAGAWKKVLDSAADIWGGTGTEVPERLVSRGRVPLTLAPQSVIVLEQKHPSAPL